MTAIENHELKGITLKNILVTVMSTASIVASVMTTYFGLKADINEIKNIQQADARINNLRIKVLEDHVTLLQRQVDEIKLSCFKDQPETKNSTKGSKTSYSFLTAFEKH